MDIRFHYLNRNCIDGVKYIYIPKRARVWKLFQIGIVRESPRNWWVELVFFNREINANIFWLDRGFKAQLKAEEL